MSESIIITKTKGGILTKMGLLRKTDKEVLKIEPDGLDYNSTLGNVGKINSDNIEFIVLSKYKSSKVIKIGLSDNYKFKFKYQLKKFAGVLSEIYYNDTGAEILIFPQDTDVEISELAELLKAKLNK